VSGPGGAALIAWLADREALRDLPQRYARAVDQRDFDALDALFHPEGVVDGMRGRAEVPAYLATMRATPASCAVSMHVLGDPLITLEPGADTATMDTYAVVHQLERVQPPHDDATMGMRYLDEVVRTDDGWRIRHRRVELRWQRTTPRPA